MRTNPVVSRRVRRLAPISSVLLLGLLLAACGKSDASEPTPEPGVAAEPQPAEPAAPEPEPAAAPEDERDPAEPVQISDREPTADEVPVPEDFEVEAEQQITAKSLRSELDALEREIGKP